MAWIFVLIFFGGGGITPRHHLSICCEWIPLMTTKHILYNSAGVPTCAASLYSRSRYCLLGDSREIRHSWGDSYIWGKRSIEFKVPGYADDTAVYLRDRAAISQVVTILDDLASVSGLVTNRMIVALDSRRPALPLIICGLTLLISSESCRYLGVLVSDQDAVADNWNKCIRSLNSRLC